MARLRNEKTLIHFYNFLFINKENSTGTREKLCEIFKIQQTEQRTP